MQSSYCCSMRVCSECCFPYTSADSHGLARLFQQLSGSFRNELTLLNMWNDPRGIYYQCFCEHPLGDVVWPSGIWCGKVFRIVEPGQLTCDAAQRVPAIGIQLDCKCATRWNVIDADVADTVGQFA